MVGPWVLLQSVRAKPDITCRRRLKPQDDSPANKNRMIPRQTIKNLSDMNDDDSRKDDFIHRYTRRKHGHDYYAPAIYHIILKKHPAAPVFGSLTGDPRVAPGNFGCASIARTPLGKIVQKEVYDLRYAHPYIQVLQFIVMPDHVHVLIRITQRLPKHIGFYISGVKAAVKKKWTALTIKENQGIAISEAEIFEENYTDRIIHRGRSLDAVFKYIKDNPHRLAIRKLHPEFFSRIRSLRIGEEKYQAYGNALLLRNPFKSQVVVHRRNSVTENEMLVGQWIEEITQGGVLVSPFISVLEKSVFVTATERGGKIIYVQKEPFCERYKPTGREFELCREGRLLIVVPERPFESMTMRQIFLKMNKISEEIACGNFTIG